MGVPVQALTAAATGAAETEATPSETGARPQPAAFAGTGGRGSPSAPATGMGSLSALS